MRAVWTAGLRLLSNNLSRLARHPHVADFNARAFHGCQHDHVEILILGTFEQVASHRRRQVAIHTIGRGMISAPRRDSNIKSEPPDWSVVEANQLSSRTRVVPRTQPVILEVRRFAIGFAHRLSA